MILREMISKTRGSNRDQSRIRVSDRNYTPSAHKSDWTSCVKRSEQIVEKLQELLGTEKREELQLILYEKRSDGDLEIFIIFLLIIYKY